MVWINPPHHFLRGDWRKLRVLLKITKFKMSNSGSCEILIFYFWNGLTNVCAGQAPCLAMVFREMISAKTGGMLLPSAQRVSKSPLGKANPLSKTLDFRRVEGISRVSLPSTKRLKLLILGFFIFDIYGILILHFFCGFFRIHLCRSTCAVPPLLDYTMHWHFLSIKKCVGVMIQAPSRGLKVAKRLHWMGGILDFLGARKLERCLLYN